MVAHCSESDPCELLARIHDRHTVWTRLELTKGAQGNFRIARHPATSGSQNVTALAVGGWREDA
jgi:hypothetical protein